MVNNWFVEFYPVCRYLNWWGFVNKCQVVFSFIMRSQSNVFLILIYRQGDGKIVLFCCTFAPKTQNPVLSRVAGVNSQHHCPCCALLFTFWIQYFLILWKRSLMIVIIWFHHHHRLMSPWPQYDTASLRHYALFKISSFPDRVGAFRRWTGL